MTLGLIIGTGSCTYAICDRKRQLTPYFIFRKEKNYVFVFLFKKIDGSNNKKDG